MTYSTDELYTIVNTSQLKKLGENASTLHQLLLFDNLAGYSPGSDADFFFSQNLIKLGADMILICLTGGINYMSELTCTGSKKRPFIYPDKFRINPIWSTGQVTRSARST